MQGSASIIPGVAIVERGRSGEARFSPSPPYAEWKGFFYSRDARVKPRGLGYPSSNLAARGSAVHARYLHAGRPVSFNDS